MPSLARCLFSTPLYDTIFFFDLTCKLFLHRPYGIIHLMYYPHTKEIAKEMRKNGASLGEISKKLRIAKSTLSLWCKDIILTESAIRKIKTKGKLKSVRGLLRYSEFKRKERLKRNALQRQEGATLLAAPSNRDILMVGLGLYWGEGYKYDHSELGFTNSNLKIIKFYIKWLRLFKISKDDLIFRLTINKVFEKYANEIKEFWAKELSVKENQFSKTTLIKTKLKKANLKNMESYKGILRVKVRKGTSLRNKILGAIEKISSL